MAFHRVLIAVDASPLAAPPAEIGMELARTSGAEVAFVHVLDPKLAIAPEGGLPAVSLMEEVRRQGEALLAAVTGRATLSVAPKKFLREGKPDQEIVETAREWNADVVVIGTHGRSGLTRLFFGSTAEGVVRHAPSPVLVVRKEAA